MTTSPTPTGAALEWQMEIKSCPFCGAELRIGRPIRPDGSKGKPRLLCMGHRDDDDCFFMDFDTEEEAIAFANRRAPIAPAALGDVEFDANVNRLKACEHIADGDEGWEVLRNECPSTAAVARLRDALAGMREERERLREALSKCQPALDILMRGVGKHTSSAEEIRTIHDAYLAIERAALSQAQERRGKEE